MKERKLVRGGGGGVNIAFIRLEMRSSSAIMENDDKLAQAIPTICTFNLQTFKMYYHKKYTLLHVSASVSHIWAFSFTKEFWMLVRKNCRA